MTDVIDPNAAAAGNAAGQAGAGEGAGAGDGTGQAGEGAGASASWLDALPDELKTNEALKNYKDPAELAKAYLETAAKIETPPETADGYEIKVNEELPVDPNFVNWFKQTAHKLGLSQAKAQEMAAAYAELEMAAMREMKIADEKAMNALKVQWGSTFEENKSKAMDGFNKFADETMKQWATDSGLADDPMFLRLFSAIGKAISDDKLIDAGAGTGPQLQYSQSGQPMLRYDKTPGMGAPAT